MPGLRSNPYANGIRPCRSTRFASTPAASATSGIRFFLLRTQEGWKIKEVSANGSDAPHLALW
jgi:hypothetical protein